MNLFEIVDGSLKISYEGEVTLLIAKKDIAIITNELYKSTPRAVIYNLNLGYNDIVLTLPLSVCTEDGVNPFDADSFIAFAETNFSF